MMTVAHDESGAGLFVPDVPARLDLFAGVLLRALHERDWPVIVPVSRSPWTMLRAAAVADLMSGLGLKPVIAEPADAVAANIAAFVVLEPNPLAGSSDWPAVAALLDRPTTLAVVPGMGWWEAIQSLASAAATIMTADPGVLLAARTDRRVIMGLDPFCFHASVRGSWRPGLRGPEGDSGLVVREGDLRADPSRYGDWLAAVAAAAAVRTDVWDVAFVAMLAGAAVTMPRAAAVERHTLTHILRGRAECLLSADAGWSDT